MKKQVGFTCNSNAKSAEVDIIQGLSPFLLIGFIGMLVIKLTFKPTTEISAEVFQSLTWPIVVCSGVASLISLFLGTPSFGQIIASFISASFAVAMLFLSAFLSHGSIIFVICSIFVVTPLTGALYRIIINKLPIRGGRSGS
ncbi:MAG: hypothetical protein ACHP6H_02250 [Legionellales bacterium]